MSETNQSLQVRTDNPAHIVARLRELGFSGFVFRGPYGWLTVVPHGGPDGLVTPIAALAQFAAKLGSAVVNIQSNDFGWGFDLALPDGTTTSFEKITADPADMGLNLGSYKPPPPDETMLAAVAQLDRVRPFLRPTPPVPDDGEEAHRFAAAMGFAQFSWLSPFYVTDDPGEARRRGGEEIGHRPESIRGHVPP